MTPSGKHHYGLTLVEVLISTVLLAMLASACLPLIARAMQLLHDTAAAKQTEEIDFAMLGELADDVIADPKACGLDELPMSGEFTVTWKEDSERPPVRVRILEATERHSTTEHQWLEFRFQSEKEYRGWAPSVYRWRHIELPEVAVSAQPGGRAR